MAGKSAQNSDYTALRAYADPVIISNLRRYFWDDHLALGPPGLWFWDCSSGYTSTKLDLVTVMVIAVLPCGFRPVFFKNLKF